MFTHVAMFSSMRPLTWKDAGPLGAALYNCLWAYDGWSLVSNITEEMKDLEKNLFLSIVTGPYYFPTLTYSTIVYN